MYAYFRGSVVHVGAQGKGAPCEVWLEAGSVGYRLAVAPWTAKRLSANQEVLLYVSQSSALYGGETTLYGFLTEEDRALFDLLRDVPGSGAKKALDYFEKIKEKSPVSFLQGLLRGDAKMLGNLFGFRPKTADKMLANLKDRAEPLLQKMLAKGAVPDQTQADGPLLQFDGALWERAREALAALGFDYRNADQALGTVLRLSEGDENKPINLETLVRRALRELGAGRAG
ncbi:MAG: hypothetical protein HYT79_01465 [Elusimicrobia bacterium]|nr:hypothetical protein [Elusimicrobiota bacterium]